MKKCIKCLYNEYHPLYLTFNNKGVCSGCEVHQEKDEIEWNSKWSELVELVSSYKNKSGKNYDCIVPVSGARDSFYMVHTVKNKLGLNPLLVTYNKQYNTDLGIRNLAKLRTVFNADIFTLTVNPQKLKKITKATIRRRGSIYWHCIAGQTVFPVQVAVKLKIPLIIWGAHQGIDQVGMYSHLDKIEMTRKYRHEHDLMGLEAEDLISDLDKITESDIFQFSYPDSSELQKVGVRGIYLNNYLRWDSKKQHEEMLGLYNYETSFQTRTFDSYNDVDCFNYSDLHDYTKFIKHGYSKVVDHAVREIRLGRLTKEEGESLVKKYIHKKPENADLFFKWLGLSSNGFNFLLDQHRNPKVWARDENFQWVLKEKENESDSSSEVDLNFKIKNFNKVEEDYIILGKGFPYLD